MKIAPRLGNEESILVHFHSISQHVVCSGQSFYLLQEVGGSHCSEYDPITLLSREMVPFHAIVHLLYLFDFSCFISPGLELSSSAKKKPIYAVSFILNILCFQMVAF